MDRNVWIVELRELAFFYAGIMFGTFVWGGISIGIYNSIALSLIWYILYLMEKFSQNERGTTK